MTCRICKETQVELKAHRVLCYKCYCRKHKIEDPVGHWANRWIKRCKYKYKRRTKLKQEFNLTTEYLVRKFVEAKKKYPELSFDSEVNYPSIDRINNKRGYIKRNIQIIPKWLNCAKNVASQEDIDLVIHNYYKTHLEIA